MQSPPAGFAHESVVKVLLAKGARVDLGRGGDTPRTIAQKEQARARTTAQKEAYARIVDHLSEHEKGHPRS